MSIARLRKITILGLDTEKREIVAGLQDLGCLHLIPRPVRGPDAALDDEAGGPSRAARDALRFLRDCPQRRHQATDAGEFDPQAVEDRALALQQRIAECADEIDFLRERIADVEPWGDFRMPTIGELDGHSFWFYAIPHHRIKALADRHDLVFAQVGRDNRFRYVVVIAQDEPGGMPAPRTHTGSQPLSTLRQRLDDAETELEDLRIERYRLTRWIRLFEGSIASLEDRASRRLAESWTRDDEGIFALQAWAPADRIADVEAFARDRDLAMVAAPPDPADRPPTLLRNPAPLDGGEPLVTFYTTPGYRTADPSAIVFFSFTLFFAMILSDAGYAAVLGVLLASGWRRLGRMPASRKLRPLLAAIVAASIAWGSLVGSWFGVAPQPGSWLARLHVVDARDFAVMMPLSVSVGVAHLAVANLLEAIRLRGTPAMAVPLGWIAVLAGGLGIWFGGRAGDQPVEAAGAVAAGAGTLAVFLFAGTGRGWPGWLAGGLGGVARLTNIFGDVLSYMRLFALGLASGSLAIAFNDLARQAGQWSGGIGVLFMLLILIVGHGLNLVLGIMGGVVHGLRLNVIEFFNWALAEEGTPFKPFARRENTLWNH